MNTEILRSPALHRGRFRAVHVSLRMTRWRQNGVPTKVALLPEM